MHITCETINNSRETYLLCRCEDDECHEYKGRRSNFRPDIYFVRFWQVMHITCLFGDFLFKKGDKIRYERYEHRRAKKGPCL